VHWGGDSTATFESMAESLRGGLSLCLSGFGFWSHDIGGFEHTASADVYKRWCAFGLLSSHSRLHGSGSYRVPWLFDEAGYTGPTASDVLRTFTKLKCRLMPYLYGAAVEAHERGVPAMRAMLLEFPDDPGCDTLDRQYMLGGSLLVAPVFSPDGTVDDRPDYDYADGVTFHVFQLQDGAAASARVPALTGATALSLEASRRGQKIQIRTTGASRAWSVLLRGIDAVECAEGGTAQPDPLGTRLAPAAGSRSMTVHL